jgi:Ca-activated chloride channel homolog
MIKVNAKLGYPVVNYKEDGENYLLITVEGEELPDDTKRPPISVVALLDVSGSMSPEYKIGYLKKSVVKLIDNLKECDRLSLVEYTTGVRVITSLTNMTPENKKAAISAVEKIYAQNMTNISGALTVGFEEFRKTSIEEGVNRIILFTDGCPTEGNCDPKFLIELAGKAPDGVQVTTMGYGRQMETSGLDDVTRGIITGMGGEINVALLQDMAKSGKGNYYYIANPDSCGRAFANELAGLLTVVGQDIKIRIEPTQFLKVEEVLDDLNVEDQNGVAVINITDLLAGETRYILAKVSTKAQAKAWVRQGTVANITVEYNNPIEGKADTETVKAKLLFAKKGFTKEMDKDVKTQLAVIDALKAQQKAFDLAAQGDYGAAQNTLTASINYLSSVGTARADSFIGGMSITKDMCANVGSFTTSHNVRCASMTSMKSGRASGGVYDAVYATNLQKNMQDNFVDGDRGDTTSNIFTTGDPWKPVNPIDPVDPFKPIDPIDPTHPNIPLQPQDPKTHKPIKKSFEKKSKTERW